MNMVDEWSRGHVVADKSGAAGDVDEYGLGLYQQSIENLCGRTEQCAENTLGLNSGCTGDFCTL